MRSKIAGRVLAAVLALGMLFATTAGACAEELVIEGVGSEALTEEGSEAFEVSDDEFVFEDAGVPAADAEYADEDSFYDEEAAPEDVVVDGEDAIETAEETADDTETAFLAEKTAEDISEDALILVEENEEGSLEETLTEEAYSEGLTEEEISGIEEDAASENISEEALGDIIPILYGSDPYDGKYGENLSSGILEFDTSELVSFDLKMAGYGTSSTKEAVLSSKNFKVMEAKPAKSGKKVATVSKKGVITVKNAGTAIVVCYGADKKPIGYFPLSIKSNSAKKIIKKESGKELSEYILVNLPDGSTVNYSDYYASFGGEHTTYSSSNKKVLEIDADGKVTVRKNGKATVTVSYKGAPKGSTFKDGPYTVHTKIKFKFTVKTPSIKGSVSVKPGKSYTIKVKNASAENEVIYWDYEGQTVTLEKSGNYNQKCKVTTDQNGGITCVRAEMKSGEVLECFIVCSQTKKRVYTDGSFTTQESSYDTKSLKKVTKAVNNYRKTKGLKTLKTNKTANVVADVYARMSDKRYKPDNIVPILRKSGASVADIVKEINEGNIGKWSENGEDNLAKATSLGVTVYVLPNEEGVTQYLLVVYGVVPAV